MGPNRTATDETSGSGCHRKFRTEQELQGQKEATHSQEENKQRGSDRTFNQPSQGEEKRERVA
jgi:hypothetical protein